MAKKSLSFEFVHLYNLLKDLHGSEVSYAQNPVSVKRKQI